MVESRLHAFLKKVGAAFLVNRGCFLVGTEVPLGRFGQRRLHDLDGHQVIDVCGVGERFFKLRGADGELGRGGYEVARNILRGVEVKVSRSDFRNGFVCTACNYNYLLAPMRLVAPWEVPRGVGLIEYNRHKFGAERTEGGDLRFNGLRAVKRPSFTRIRSFQVDNATAFIARRRTGKELVDSLEDSLRDVSIFV